MVDAVPDDRVTAAGSHRGADSKDKTLVPGALQEVQHGMALGRVREKGAPRCARVVLAGRRVLWPLPAAAEEMV